MAYRYSTNVSKTDTATSKRRPATQTAFKGSADNALNKRLPSGNSGMASALRNGGSTIKRGTAVNPAIATAAKQPAALNKRLPSSNASALSSALSSATRRRTIQKPTVMGTVRSKAKRAK